MPRTDSRGTLISMSKMLLLALSSFVCFGAEPSYEIVPDLVYGHKMGMALTMDQFKPKERANGAGILFMVSGGWRSNWAPPETLAKTLFLPLLEKGFTVFAVRHGSSPKFNIPEIVEDVRTAVRYVRFKSAVLGVDPNRLGVYGGSAGGHLSLMLGTTSDNGKAESKQEVERVSNRVAAVVAYFPPTDIRPWVTDGPDYNKSFPALKFETAKGPDYSPLLFVTPDDPPTLLIHGDQDKLVALEHSEKILAAFQTQKVPAELIVMKGAGHGFQGDDSARASKAMVAWFEKYLTGREKSSN
jgi:acetyl esterase/lipase